MIFIENIRQSVRNLQHKCGSESHFIFRFQQRPEFIQVGMKFILYNGINFAAGIIIQLYPLNFDF